MGSRSEFIYLLVGLFCFLTVRMTSSALLMMEITKCFLNCGTTTFPQRLKIQTLMPRALSSIFTSTLPSTHCEVTLPDKYVWLFDGSIFCLHSLQTQEMKILLQYSTVILFFVIYKQNCSIFSLRPRCCCFQNVHYVVLQAFVSENTWHMMQKMLLNL